MGIMSQVYAERRERQEQAEILRDDLETASMRMHIMAEKVEESGHPELAKLYRQWADEAHKAAENPL
jgi:rubrerythrin